MKFRKVATGLALALGVVWTTSEVQAQESALGEAREKVKVAPASAEASLAYGRALRRAGHENDALRELRRGVGLTAGKADLAAKLTWEIARTQIAQRQFEQAMATCNGLAKVPNAAAASHVCKAESHLLWRRGTEATAELAEVAKAKDASAEVQYFAKVAEGRVRELEAREADGEAAYKEAIRLAPDRPEAHVYLGAMLHRVGKDGVPSLKKAVEIDPKDPVAQLELGRALPLGSAESVAALERAVAERPTYTDALRALAEGYIAQKRLPEAKKTAESVLKIAPNDVFSHVVAGRVALAEGKADEALKEGETASKLMPNAAAAKLLIADAWAKKGEIDLAVEAYQAAFGLDHSDAAPLVNAAHACITAGRITSAKAFARRATQDFPQLFASWLALGDALLADKDKDGARSAYESAKKTKDADTATIEERARRAKTQ
jgi:tetratricopeptide (TPR) repeat protein